MAVTKWANYERNAQWNTGDVITEAKMNNIEDEVEKISATVRNMYEAGINASDTTHYDTAAWSLNRKLNNMIQCIPHTTNTTITDAGFDPTDDLYNKLWIDTDASTDIEIPSKQAFEKYKYRINTMISYGGSTAPTYDQTQYDGQFPRIWIKGDQFNSYEVPTMTDLNNATGDIKDYIAPTFSTSTAYTKGQYVWNANDGKLYQFTANHAAGVWSDGDTSEVVIGEGIKENRDQISDLKSAVSGMYNTVASKNLLNPSTITEGKFYKTATVDGRVKIIQSDNSAYSCAYIDITSGEDYSITGISYTVYTGDADGFAIGQAYPTNTSVSDPDLDTDAVANNYGNTDKTITRIYFSWRHATYPTESYMANAGSTLLTYEPYTMPYRVLSNDIYIKENNVLPEEYTVDINGGGDYTSFTACLEALANNTNDKTIYIKPGTYDVFEEIGGATFAAQVEEERQADPSNYSWFDCSVVVPPHTKIIGIGEVVLEFKPTSSEITAEVMSLLSPVNVIYDIYMENITIDCDNCRYGIHDETGHIDGVIGTRHIYKNVKIIKAQTNGGMNAAFGCGMQKNQYMEFDCCNFSSPNRPFSFHNKGTGGVVDNTIIVIKNCVAKTSGSSGNALRFGNVNGYQVKIDVRVFNSYLNGANVWVGNESSTERPNAYNLTIVGCGNPTVTIESETNIYTPTVLQI